jgi:hypothetical protein
MGAMGELVQGERRGRWVTLACVLVLLSAAAPAPAATVGTIPGSPLTINADDNGQLQVTFNGSSTGEFFSPSSQSANAGFNLAIAQGANAFAVYGFQGSAFSSITAPTVTGNGSAGNPWVLSASYATDTPGTNLATVVNEKVTYVNGTTDVGLQYTVVYQGDLPGPVNVRAYEAADLYVSGSDSGAGFLDAGPPRQVGGINQAQGSSGRLVEQSPAWSHYQEGRYSDVFDVIGAAGTFNDAIDPALLDNGVGVQWDGISLATQGSSQTLQVTWRFRRFSPLTLSLAAVAKQQGQIATATVSARNSDGNPDPGRTVRYTLNGANPGSGAVTTGADGNATISWTGAFAGTDTLSAFTDLNNNGSPDAGEPTQTATVTFGPPPAPVPGKSVVVKVVSGTVTIKYPAGYTPRAAAPRAAGFVPFTGAANIPVGSQLDTSKGRIALTSAADTGGAKTQTSDFYDGIFQIKQTLPKKKPTKPTALVTDLVMKGQIPRSQCAPLKGARSAVADAKKKKKGPKSVLGKLWGTGKGKFRTDGKYSSATVRGTIWLVEDRCDGTLTQVKRGVVSVRDIKRKKTVKVKAGHSYLASAVTRRKKK